MENSARVFVITKSFNPARYLNASFAVIAAESDERGGKLPSFLFLLFNFLMLEVSMTFSSSRFFRKHSKHAVLPGMTICPIRD